MSNDQGLTDLPGSLADRIRKARTKRRFSQSKTAILLGVNRATVAKWEMKQGQVPGSLRLLMLARLLQVSHEWLVSGGGPMELTGHVTKPSDVTSSSPHGAAEERLLQLYRLLPSQQRKNAMDFMEATHCSTWRDRPEVVH